MSSVAVRRLIDVVRPEGDATVVLAAGGVELASWPLAGSAHPDLDVIDALARLALAARRLGGEIELRGAGVELLSLIDFVGLDDIVVTAEPRYQASAARAASTTSARQPSSKGLVRPAESTRLRNGASPPRRHSAT